MIVPSNMINQNQYTAGGEFVLKVGNTNYKGYYYGFNGKFYVGKKFDQKSPELIPISQSNKLLDRKSTVIYSLVSGKTSQDLQLPRIPSIPPNYGADVRYFYRQVNINPIIIREISEDTYNEIKDNAFFQTAIVARKGNIEESERQLPGLKAFLSV